MISAADQLVAAMVSARADTLTAEAALRITDAVRKPIADVWSDLYP